MGILFVGIRADCYSSISVNTALGLSFLRFINEDGLNGWAQVYARIPFDEIELATKGALLGAVFGGDRDNWADLEAELTTWIDEYFNKTETGIDLVSFFLDFRNKYSGLSGIWVCVTLNKQNEREIRLVKWGEAGLMLLRKGRDFDLTSSLEEGKVIRGVLEANDCLILWTPQNPNVEGLKIIDEKVVSDWDLLLKQEERTAAGMVLKIEKKETQPVTEEVIETKTVLNQELVSDRFVGPIGLKQKMWNWWKQKRERKERTLIIKKEVLKNKKWAAVLGMVFLLLLLISILAGSWKIRSEEMGKKWQSFSEPIEKNMQEARDLGQINPGGAKKIMEEVRIDFESKKNDFVGGKYAKNLADLEKKMNDSWVAVSGERQSAIDMIVNIGLVRSGFKGEKLSLVKDDLFLVLDKMAGVVVSTEVNTKDIKVVAGKGETQDWLDVLGDGKTVWIMSKTGIVVANKDQKVITFDNAVVSPISLGRFGDSLYVLDQANKEIFKYAATNDSFGERTRWLKQGQIMDINPVDMAIDGDVWIVSEDGQIDKFRRGVKESFTVSGLPAEIKVSRMAVSLSTDSLGLLDKTKGVVILCSKTTGNCNQQLNSDNLKLATDIEFNGAGTLQILMSDWVGGLK